MVRQSIKRNKFHFIPDTLICEICLISLFFFIFTATTVAMLLLLHTPFLPSDSLILHLVNAGITIQQNVNDLITGMLTGNIS